jgi:hemin uptake protein HemP
MNTLPYPASDERPARAGLPASRTSGPLRSSRPASVPTAELPRWSSETLLHGGHQVEITHGDQVYRLRLTSLGKLILTK